MHWCGHACQWRGRQWLREARLGMKSASDRYWTSDDDVNRILRFVQISGTLEPRDMKRADLAKVNKQVKMKASV